MSMPVSAARRLNKTIGGSDAGPQGPESPVVRNLEAPVPKCNGPEEAGKCGHAPALLTPTLYSPKEYPETLGNICKRKT